MIGWLLFISFLFHGVGFYWILHLRKHVKETSEIEGILEAYTEEMKEENDRLIRQIKTFSENTSQTNEEASYSEGQRGEDEEDLSDHEWVIPPKTEITEKGDSDVSNNETSSLDKNETNFEYSFEASVFSLVDQGFNHEEIAKKLGRGKGEIALLMRLSKAKGNQ